MSIPTEISDKTSQEATAEISGILRRVIESDENHQRTLSLDNINQICQWLGMGNTSVVFPLETTEGKYPLCVKFGYGPTSRHTSMELRNYITKDEGSPFNVSRKEIEDNRKVLVQLGVDGLMVPPQRYVEIVPENKGLVLEYNCLLVPDLSCNGTLTLIDLSEVDGWDANDPLFQVYSDVLKKMDPLDIQFIGHVNTSKPRMANLESCVKRMLFLVEGDGQRFMAAGDLNHFKIKYGSCYHCGKAGPILRVPDPVI